METVDAGLVFLQRFTTLVGAAEFTTAPVDVSGQGGTQFQVWRGPIRTSSGAGTLDLYLEESLDAQAWALGPSTPAAIPLASGATQFVSYSFRLRWFRLRFSLGGSNPMVSCWAEGILRGGEGGAWGGPQTGMFADGKTPAGWLGPQFRREEEDPWARLRDYYAQVKRDPRILAWDPTAAERLRRKIEVDWMYGHGGVKPTYRGFPIPAAGFGIFGAMLRAGVTGTPSLSVPADEFKDRGAE